VVNFTTIVLQFAFYSHKTLKGGYVVRRTLCILIFCALLVPSIACAVEPLNLSWNLAEEERAKEKKEYVVSTTQEGWNLLTKKSNWITYQGFELPSSARYLTSFSIDTEVKALRHNGKFGIYLANEKVDIVFCIEYNEAALRVGASGKVNKVSSGMRIAPSFPSKLRMVYDISNNTIKCYYNEEEVINKNFSDIANMPNISTIQYAGVVAGTKYDTTNSEYTFKSFNLKAN